MGWKYKCLWAHLIAAFLCFSTVSDEAPGSLVYTMLSTSPGPDVEGSRTAAVRPPVQSSAIEPGTSASNVDPIPVTHRLDVGSDGIAEADQIQNADPLLPATLTNSMPPSPAEADSDVSTVDFNNSTAERCDGKIMQYVARAMTKSLRSPGYPENYEENDECIYVITTALPSDDYMMQIAAVQFDLNDYNNDCNTDYLDIYEGDMASGTLVDRWCGFTEAVHKTRSDTVTLRFKSDNALTSKGFAIFFSVVEYASAQCEETAQKPIVVGTFPLYESFQGSKTLSKCEWNIEASDKDKRLVVEMFKSSKISCGHGVFNFYEGHSTSGHISYQYCSTLNPFSEIYLTSHQASLTFEPAEGVTLENTPDDLILKFSTRSHMYRCTSADHATLEIGKDPVIFSLPHAVNGSGHACPVTLVTPEEFQFLRLDVMGTGEGEVTCDSNLIEVTGSRHGRTIPKECNEATFTPVYRQTSTEGMEIKSLAKPDLNIYLRASTVPKACSGSINVRTAYEEYVVTDIIPSEEGYPKYLISAKKANDVVSLNLTWNQSQEDKDLLSAPGDFIKIYDGEDEASSVLFSSREKKDALNGKVLTVVSTQKNMLVVLDSDARITGKSANISYFSLPGGKSCPSTSKKIMLGRSQQIISSPNYPDALPLHQTCIYHLISENPNDNIVVEVVDSNLQTHCENLLMVFDGDYVNSETHHVLGRVCGKDRPVFKLPKKDVTLVAKSEDAAGPGGWKVRAYTQAKPPPSGSDGLKPAHSICLVYLLIVVGVIALVKF